MNDVIMELLDKVSCASKSTEFNVFLVTGIGTREVYMHRFLTELLNPRGTHRMGRIYLDLFFEHVLTKTKKPSEDSRIDVVPEWLTSDGRRIDTIIEYDDVRIPIEVKIYAGDQLNQCADYVKCAKNSPLYYLTIDGREPPDWSASADERKKIEIISWCLIHEWLNICIETTNANNSLLYAVLRQYAAAVKNFVEKDNVIVDIINTSPEYFQAALDITNSINAAKDKMIELIDEKLRNAPYNLKLYDDTLRAEGHTYKFDHSKTRTYLTDDPDILFRVQYKDNNFNEIIVTFIRGVKATPKKVIWDKFDKQQKVVDFHDLHLIFDNDHLDRFVVKIAAIYNSKQ